MKLFKKIACLVFSAIFCLFSFTACNFMQSFTPLTGKDLCKQTLKNVLVAESFSVKIDGEQTMVYGNNSAYLKRNYEGKFDEVCLTTDSDGKKWIYHRTYEQDKWEKTALSALEYASTLYATKRSLSLDLNLDNFGMFTLFDLCYSCFDDIMVEDNGNFCLNSSLDESLQNLSIVFWVENYNLGMQISTNGETHRILICDIDKTQFVAPESLQNSTIVE